MEKVSSSRSIEKVAERVRGKIQRASDINDPFKILVYGRPGKFKTRTLATMPNVLLVDINDRGTRSTKRDLDPNVYILDRAQELDDIYWFLAEGDHDFESVALDGITGLQTLVLKFVMNDEAIRDASRDPNMPSRTSWGKANELMKNYITNFRNLPLHVGFSALERSRDIAEDDSDESQIVVSPAVSPGVAAHLEAAVGTIGRLTTREVKVKKKGNGVTSVVRAMMQLGPSERYITKDRDGIFSNVILNPHIGRMIQQIEGGQ
jgi:AAA domain-containing protein